MYVNETCTQHDHPRAITHRGDRRVIAVLPLLLLVACTRRHNMTGLHDVDGHVEVTARNGQVYEAVVTQTAKGPIFTLSSGAVFRVRDVTRVLDRRGVQGSLEGFVLGALPGIAIGAALGYSRGDDNCDATKHWCFFVFDAEDKAYFGGAIAGFLTGAAGFIFGAVRGSQYIYEDETSHVTVTAVGPSGSLGGLTVSF